MADTHMILVYGAGGHGKLVADVCLALGRKIEGFVDDNPQLEGKHVLDLPVFPAGWLRQKAAERPVAIVLGVGNNGARKRLAEYYRSAGIKIVTAIHPAATISSSAYIGNGTTIMAGAVINPGAHIGDGVIVNSGAVIEHDVVLGDYSHISTNAAIGGGASVGTLAMLGVGAAMRPLARVGAGTIVGAGSVVIRDIPAHVIAVGVPARAVRSVAEVQPQSMTAKGTA